MNYLQKNPGTEKYQIPSVGKKLWKLGLFYATLFPFPVVI